MDQITVPAPVETKAEKKGPPARACPNCGTWVDDEFCPRCGQRNATRLVSVRRFVRDALEDSLSLEGRLPRTAGALLFRPGHLTAEYLRGRIARYVPPLRLYLVGSVVFFFALSWVLNVDRMWRQAGPAIEAQAARDSTVENVGLGIDTVGAPGWARPLLTAVMRKVQKLNDMPPREALRAQFQALLGIAPPMIFLVVPLLAALLKLLYLRRKRLYAEHFVFALHFHAFGFLVGSALILSNRDGVDSLLGMALLLYLFLALKRVYAQGWLRTAARYAVLLVLYSALVSAIFLAIGVASLLSV